MVKRFLSFQLCLVFFATATQVFSQDTLQHVVAGRINSPSQYDKPYLILISIDGMRHDLADRFQAKNLLELRSSGVQAEYMRPSFPSLTFPNHYTIVTGLRPSHSGLVGNKFWDDNRGYYYMGNKWQVADSSWYGGTPLWVTAEKQGMLTASFYWVASETAIEGVRPTYYYVYNEKIGIDQRIEAVKTWLSLPKEQRPHLITFYFPQVDHAGHVYGPASAETGEAVRFVDESIGKLVSAVSGLGLPVNFIVVSDHGMADVDSSKAIALPAAVDTTRFAIGEADAELHLYSKNGGDVKSTYRALKREANNYSVYLKKKVPARWHYGRKDDWHHRLPDILLVANPPAFFHVSTAPITNKGMHGFDPYIDDMHATFYAWGPAFKTHQQLPGFDNIHVYPLIAEILHLTYDPKNIDGKLSVLQPALK